MTHFIRDEKYQALQTKLESINVEIEQLKDTNKELEKIRKIAEELISFVSYAEITSGILINREPIRKLCDDFMVLNNPFRNKELIKLMSNTLKETIRYKRVDLVEYIKNQIEFSEKTFGPDKRTEAITDHIKKELIEVAEEPNDLLEWIDLVILALDGAWRSGYTPEQVVDALHRKQIENNNREWPDWRTVPQDKAIEHLRNEDAE